MTQIGEELTIIEDLDFEIPCDKSGDDNPAKWIYHRRCCERKFFICDDHYMKFMKYIVEKSATLLCTECGQTTYKPVWFEPIKK